MVAVTREEFFERGEIKHLNELKDRPIILYRRFQEIFNRSFRHQGIKPYYSLTCNY